MTLFSIVRGEDCTRDAEENAAIVFSSRILRVLPVFDELALALLPAPPLHRPHRNGFSEGYHAYSMRHPSTSRPILAHPHRQVSADWNGRPRLNTIRQNEISYPVESHGVAVTDSDDNEISENVFVGIESLRFDNATETLVVDNVLPDGVSFNLDDGATLAAGSQDPTD